MVCYPCQVGGKEYKGYGSHPFPKGSSRADIREKLKMKNDWEHAHNKSGKDLGEYVSFKTYATGRVPDAYHRAISFEDFLKKKVVKGKLLLMNFQLKCKKTVNGEKNPKRFYVAEFPFENVKLLRQKVSFTVQPQTVPICGMQLGWGKVYKPCSVKVNYDEKSKKKTIDINSDPLKVKGVPYEAIWIVEDLKL